MKEVVLDGVPEIPEDLVKVSSLFSPVWKAFWRWCKVPIPLEQLVEKMWVERKQNDEDVKKIVEFLKQHKGMAFTEEEVRKETGVNPGRVMGFELFPLGVRRKFIVREGETYYWYQEG